MRRKRALGFTLVELAVVILLISIFMGLGLSALDVQQTNRAYSETREKQEKIKDALVFHLSNFRRLPCPDTTALTAPNTPPDGLEDRVNAPPTVPTNPCVNTGVAVPGFGVIPYADLGLSRDDALDGWDNFFTYQVSLGGPNEWTLPATFRTPPSGFFTGNGGAITLNGRDATGAQLQLNVPGALGIAAIIVSHGRNGSGAFTTKGTQNLPPAAADELDNTDANSVFFQREFTDVAVPNGGPFDDLVLALTPTDLLTPAIKDGALPSATAQALSQIETIVNTAIASVPTPPPPPCTGIPLSLAAMGLPGPVTTDPWGQTINYQPNGPAPAPVNIIPPPTPPPPITPAFEVWSSGPDRLDNTGGGDDVGYTLVNYGQLQAAFSTGSNRPCP